jgi:type IV secretory pathway VirJ component
MKKVLLSLLFILIVGQRESAKAFDNKGPEDLRKNDLVLNLVPALVKNDLPLVFFISGDGGWKKWDQNVSEELAKAGMPVVGFNAQKYFWNEKKPREVASDLTVVIKHYMQTWNKHTFILVGYSFGACVAPFIAINFDDRTKEAMKSIYCFSPDLTGDFEVHLTDMLHLNTKRKYNVVSGLMEIKFLTPICIFGDKEEPETRNEFSKTGARIRILPGDHHYNDDFKAIADVILKDF